MKQKYNFQKLNPKFKRNNQLKSKEHAMDAE